MMDAALRPTRTDRGIFQSYERDRQRRLTSIIAPLVGVLAGISCGAFTVFLVLIQSGAIAYTASPQLYILDSAIGLLAVVLGWSTFMLRRGAVILATNMTVISIGLVVLTVQTAWVTAQGMDLYGVLIFSAVMFTVQLVGVLSSTITLGIVTVGISAYMLLLWIFARPSPDVAMNYQREYLLLIVMSLVVVWGAAILLYAFQRASRQTLVELQEVRQAYERAKQLDELKDQFISSVNHELRTPLSAMLSFLEILELSAPNATAEQMTDLIADANAAGESLNQLVASILDARRLDQGAANFTAAPVSILTTLQIAARLIDPREGQMVERELRLNVSDNLCILGETIRLQQIFINLLSNAIKYSAPGTPVDVTAVRLKNSGDGKGPARRMIAITIRDYGHGIPPEQIPLLFQRFVRLPRDLASNVRGNGLGLHLCRVLAGVMGGDLRAESDGIDGEGTRFILTLPEAPPAAQPAVSERLAVQARA